jgi:hypothetical protein
MVTVAGVLVCGPSPRAWACTLAPPEVTVIPTAVSPGEPLQVQVVAYDILPQDESPPPTASAPGQPVMVVPRCPPTRPPSKLTLRFVQGARAIDLAVFGASGWPNPITVRVPRTASSGPARVIAATPSATYQSNLLTVSVTSRPAVAVDAEPKFTG